MFSILTDITAQDDFEPVPQALLPVEVREVNLRDVEAFGLDFFIAVGDLGTILLTKNGGRSWTNPSSGTTDVLNAVTIVDENTAIAVGGQVNQRGTIIGTFDSGDSWQSIQNASNDILSDVISAPPLTVLAVGRQATISKSTNGGMNWTPGQAATTKWLLAGVMVDISPVLVAGADGTVQISLDLDIWSPQTSGTSEWLTSIDAREDSTAIVVGNNGVAIGSIDFGLNWTTYNTSTTDDLTGVVFVEPKDTMNTVISYSGGYEFSAIAVGHNGTIIKTGNSGLTWAPLQSGTTQNLWGVAFNDSISIAVGDSGTILLEKRDGTTSVEEISENLPAKFKLYQNYPNPLNPSTSISFDLDAASMVTLSIYNITGQLVRTLENRRLNAGAYTFEWDGRDRQSRVSPSGLYISRLQVGSLIEQKKMLLIK